MTWHMVECYCQKCHTIDKEPVDSETIADARKRYKNGMPRVMCDRCLATMCSPQQFARWLECKKGLVAKCEPMR